MSGELPPVSTTGRTRSGISGTGFDRPQPHSGVFAVATTLITDLLAVLDTLSGGVHPGFRPVHAKGTMYAGMFVPAPGAADLTRAPHAARPSTPITVRFSGLCRARHKPDYAQSPIMRGSERSGVATTGLLAQVSPPAL